MKKRHLLLLLMALAMVPLAMKAQTTQLVQVTSLEVGSTYVITATYSGTQYAMGNTVYNTSNNHYVSTAAFSASNTTETAIQWKVISGNATDGYIFQNVGNSKYLGYTSDEYLSVVDSGGTAHTYDGTYLKNNVDSEGYYWVSIKDATCFTTSKSTSESCNIVIYKLVTGYSITLSQPSGGTISASVAGGTATTSSTAVSWFRI